MKYYVYAYLDSEVEENISFDDIIFTHRPIYIGKGQSNRMFTHLNDRKRYKYYFYNKLNKMILEENIPLIVKLKEFGSEEEAIYLEIKLIKYLGRKKSGGLLYNMTDGGDGVSGYVYTDNIKEKMSIKAIENKNHLRLQDYWNKNTILSGENHPMYGKKHKQSSIDKMIESKTGTKQSEEWVEKRTAKLRGVPLSQEHKDKLSESNRGQKRSEETKKRQSIARLGKEPHNKGKMKDIILQIDTDGSIVKEWSNLNDLIDSGFQKSNVINVCTGKRKSHAGFVWKYKSDF
jgi:hypothetical protein